MKDKPNNFDVLKRMAADNLDIRLSNEILNMQTSKKGTRVTLGIAGDVLNPIFRGTMQCCMICFDLEQFEATKKKLEAECQSNSHS